MDSKNIDYRTSHDCLDLNELIKISGIRTVTIGHTSCFYKIQSLTWLQHIKPLLDNGYPVTVEIPVIFNHHLQSAMSIVNGMLEKGIPIIVNDLGMLELINQQWSNQKIQLGIGRALTMSESNCPWSDDLFQSETKETVIAWNKPFRLLSTIKSLMKTTNSVLSVDLNLKGLTSDQLKSIQEEGFKINGIIGHSLASISRVCPFLKYGNSKKGECQHLCNAPATLELKERWHRFDGTFGHVENSTKKRIGDLLCFGNESYYEHEPVINKDIYHYLDKIVVDRRFPNHLKALMTS